MTPEGSTSSVGKTWTWAAHMNYLTDLTLFFSSHKDAKWIGNLSDNHVDKAGKI